MTLAVEARGLVRTFGAVRAVDGLDLAVEEGEILGLIGPDGAGKTTLIRMLVGIVAAEKGSVALFGYDLVRDRARTRLLLGYLSQAFSLYEDLTVAENIRFFAQLRGVGRKLRREREVRLLDFTRLAPFTGRYAGALSGGMKQKLALICTLVHQPRILFLDEPTNGVDPVSRREFWDIIGDLRGEVTVVVATPYMDEAERCDRVALMANGRILALDRPEGLRARVEDPVCEVEVDDPFGASQALAELVPSDRVQLFGDRLHVVTEVAQTRLADHLESAGFPCAVRRVAPSLEDAYVRLAAAASTGWGAA